MTNKDFFFTWFREWVEVEQREEVGEILKDFTDDPMAFAFAIGYLSGNARATVASGCDVFCSGEEVAHFVEDCKKTIKGKNLNKLTTTFISLEESTREEIDEWADNERKEYPIP